jgi:hypothetical protein
MTERQRFALGFEKCHGLPRFSKRWARCECALRGLAQIATSTDDAMAAGAKMARSDPARQTFQETRVDCIEKLDTAPRFRRFQLLDRRILYGIEFRLSAEPVIEISSVRAPFQLPNEMSPLCDVGVMFGFHSHLLLCRIFRP